MTVEFHHGALADSYEEQANKQGLKNEIENMPSVLPNKKIGQKRKNNV